MEKGYRTMNELVKALVEADRRLAEGSLDHAGLETACDDARELYERLVVLRHKARESQVQPAVPRPASEHVEARDRTVRSAPVPPVAEEPPATPGAIRLDTRPAEAAPRQVSLIEAIEATEQEPAAAAPAPVPPPPPAKAEKPSVKADRSPATLAEKLEKAAITDLSKAITLSHKFWFVAELFNGDRIAYDKGIEAINAQPGREEALAYVKGTVLSQLKKPADPEALATFMDLVQRRFA